MAFIVDPATIGPGDALVVVDVQRDFLPAGALAVPRADAIVAPIARAVGMFERAGLPIVATRDWHPPDHGSFREQGGPWPRHCVQGTAGAEIALRLPVQALLISKAERADKDAYSGFDGTDLDERLRALGVARLFVGGLATDHCVRATVKDAIARDYFVVLLVDAIAAVSRGAGARAVREMVELGAVPARAAPRERRTHAALP